MPQEDTTSYDPIGREVSSIDQNTGEVTTTKEKADNTTKTTETSYGYETAVIHPLT